MKKHGLFIVLIILLSIPVLLPLFRPGFFLTDDGEWMIIRFTAFHQALREGQFPVRFLERLNYGYGYPVANFLYPGFMYFAEPFKLIGFGFVGAIKIVIGIAMVGSAIGTYLWLAQFFSRLPAMMGGLLYLYAPYHLYDLYKRGSVGEIVALAFVPFTLWQLERKSFFWSSLGISLLILSHNTLAVLFLPIICLYSVIPLLNSKDWKAPVFRFLGILTGGLGIAAFFWIPALLELSYTKFAQTQVSDFRQYFASIELVGISTLLILGMSLFFLSRQKKDSSVNRYFLYFICLTIISAFLSLSYSTQLWEVLPVSFVQFPFRMLSIPVLAIAFLTAFILSSLKSLKQIPLIIFFCGITAFAAQPYMQPVMSFDKGDNYYATNEDTTTVKNEYMPLWVAREPQSHFERKVEILGTEHKTARIATIYYPGWKAYVNGKEVAIDYSNEQGLLHIPVPDEKASIRLTFSETPLRMVANVISLLSLILLIRFTVVYPKLWKKM